MAQTPSPARPEPPPLYYSAEGEAALRRAYDGALAALPAPHSERYVNTPSFGAVHVLECGPLAARPLVLWHGTSAPGPLMLSAGTFGPLAERFRVLVPDLPCQAGSRSDPAVLDPAAHGHGRWALEVLQALGLADGAASTAVAPAGGGGAEAASGGGSAGSRAGGSAAGEAAAQGAKPPLHMGVSLGGAVLLDLAVVRPEAIGGAVLVVPGSFCPGASYNWMPLGLKLAALLHGLLHRDWTGALLVPRMMEAMCQEPDSADPAMQAVRLAIRHCRYYPEPPRPEGITDEALRRLAAPVLLVAAERDVFGPGRGSAQRARALWPASQHEVLLLEGCKHVWDEARSGEINGRILKFAADRGLA